MATTWRVHLTLVLRLLSRHADSRYWGPKLIATYMKKLRKVENFEEKGQEGRDRSDELLVLKHHTFLGEMCSVQRYLSVLAGILFNQNGNSLVL